MVQRCIGSGVGKINVNTELRKAVLRHLSTAAPTAFEHGANVEEMLASWSAVVTQQTEDILTGFVSPTQP